MIKIGGTKLLSGVDVDLVTLEDPSLRNSRRIISSAQSISLQENRLLELDHNLVIRRQARSQLRGILALMRSQNVRKHVSIDAIGSSNANVALTGSVHKIKADNLPLVDRELV